MSPDEVSPRPRQPKTVLDSVRSYIIVVVVFFSFLLCVGVVIVLERLLLGLAQ